MSTTRVIRSNKAVVVESMREHAEKQRLRGTAYVDPRFVLPRRGI